MGTSKHRRSKGAPRRKPVRWSTHEVAALLAWADRCYEGGLNFKETVVLELTQKWPQKNYRYDAIENKMKRLWDRMGQYGTNRLDIIRRGTQCLNLDYFDDDEKMAFREAKSELFHREGHLRSRTRSKSSSPRTEPLQIGARRLSITAPPMLEQGGGQFHLRIEEEGVGRQRVRLPELVRTSALDLLDKEFREKYGYISSAEALLSTLQEWITKDASVIREREIVLREHNRILSALTEHNELLRRSNTQLFNQISRISRGFTDFQTSIKDKDDCWKVAMKHPELKRIQAIKENEETITHLKRQLYECQKITLLEPTPHISFRSIAETIGYIGDRAKAWSHRSNIAFPESLIGSGLDPNTAAILRQSLSITLETVPIEEQITESAKDVGAHNVLRALTATIFREWVFESDFYNLDDQESELLAMYRNKLLGQKDGPRLVRNLDFAATESLLTAQYFQEHVLVDKTTELTARFQELLAPFFPRTTPDSPADGMATWDQKDEEGIDLGCEELFQKALKLKTDLILTTHRYEMKTFEPGTPFNPANMIAETKEGAEIRGMSKKSHRKVRLCLFPALYSYPAETLAAADQADVKRLDVSRIVVQCRNFLRPGHDRGQEEGTILGKAVVLLENGTATSSC